MAARRRREVRQLIGMETCIQIAGLSVHGMASKLKRVLTLLSVRGDLLKGKPHFN